MKTLDEIVNDVYNYLNNRFDEEEKLTGEGAVRNFAGETVEKLATLVWEEVGVNYPKLNSKITVGKKTPYKITDVEGNYINESVDRHCFINGEFILAIECKAYLDKCYLQRADSDFNLMKTQTNTTAGIVLSIENSIAYMSEKFFLNRGNVDNIFYLATGKRNSGKEQKINKHRDRISRDLIFMYVNYINDIYLNNSQVA